MRLTTNQRRIRDFSKSRQFVTATLISSHLSIHYRTAQRALNDLVILGVMTKGKRYEDGYHYYSIKKATNKYESKYKIPFKKTELSLPDLLLIMSQPTKGESINDFEVYGRIIKAAVYHVGFRALQLKGNEEKDGPNPREVETFLQEAKEKYQDFIRLIDRLIELPIYYEDSVDTLKLFSGVETEEFIRQERIFQEQWGNGTASKQGLKERSISYLNFLKKKTTEEITEDVVEEVEDTIEEDTIVQEPIEEIVKSPLPTPSKEEQDRRHAESTRKMLAERAEKNAKWYVYPSTGVRVNVTDSDEEILLFLKEDGAIPLEEYENA